MKHAYTFYFHLIFTINNCSYNFNILNEIIVIHVYLGYIDIYDFVQLSYPDKLSIKL